MGDGRYRMMYAPAQRKGQPECVDGSMRCGGSCWHDAPARVGTPDPPLRSTSGTFAPATAALPQPYASLPPSLSLPAPPLPPPLTAVV